MSQAGGTLNVSRSWRSSRSSSGRSDADHLRVIVLNALPGIVVNIHGRIAMPGVDSKPFDLHMVPTSDRMATTQDFNIGGGFVTNLTVFVSGATPQMGQTFVIVQLIRSAGATAFLMGTLLQGYVTSTQNLGWPGSPIVNSLDVSPPLRTIVGSQPAAGAQINEVVPTGARWQLASVFAVFVTSAAIANRGAYIQVNDAAISRLQMPPAALQAAGINRHYLWAPNMPILYDPAGEFSQQPIPADTLLLEGQTLRTVTTLMDAADQWFAPIYVVREWMDAR
jgi:hypothetical protein